MRRAARLATMAVTAAAVAGLLARAGLADRPPGDGQPPVALRDQRRGTEQTFLTYPEWFLVYSPAEYAAFVKGHPPSEFPFWGHIRQFWQGYRRIARAAGDGYPVNLGYHVMIVVIGTSTTVEYACRSAYETLVGRLSELTVRHGPTAEDRFGAAVAQEYVDFIQVRPWYEFDFLRRLGGLWRSTGLWGPDPLRKWERKYALTTEYAVKALYGWLIGKATHASYDEASTVTAVVLDRLPEDGPHDVQKLRVLARLDRGRVLATIPRYQEFTRYALELAGQGVSFEEIAGNRSVILVTVVVPAGWDLADAPVEGEKVLFAQPILTQPRRQRMALVVPVGGLSAALRSLDRKRVEVEHVYDY
jgi:hypothetical protein